MKVNLFKSNRLIFCFAGYTEIKKNYKDFYATYFKKLAIDSVTYQDDEATGTFTTTEYYTIDDFFSQEKSKRRAVLEPFLINSVLKKPKETNRTMPYALSFPTRYHEAIEVRLPENWPAEESSADFRDAAFSLRSRFSRPASDRVLLEYDYENLSDHISPEQTGRFLQKMNDAEDAIAYELYSTPGSSSPIGFSSSGNGFTIAYVVLGIFALATYFYKRKNRKRNPWA